MRLQSCAATRQPCNLTTEQARPQPTCLASRPGPRPQPAHWGQPQRGAPSSAAHPPARPTLQCGTLFCQAHPPVRHTLLPGPPSSVAHSSARPTLPPTLQCCTLFCRQASAGQGHQAAPTRCTPQTLHVQPHSHLAGTHRTCCSITMAEYSYHHMMHPASPCGAHKGQASGLHITGELTKVFRGTDSTSLDFSSIYFNVYRRYWGEAKLGAPSPQTIIISSW